MKNNRLTLISGFMLPLCIACVLVFERVAQIRGAGLALLIAWQIVPFLLPCVGLFLVGRACKTDTGPRLHRAPRRSLGFIVCMSLSAVFLSLLLNCLLAALSGGSYYRTLDYDAAAGSSFAAVLCVAVLPALFEELFFRGMLPRALSDGGTAVSIIVSSAAFALCHGNIRNAVGPLAAGLVFGYMAYALDSVWPAVFGHLLNNLFTLGVAYATKAYEVLGLWPYFIAICAALFFIFTAAAMTALEKLIKKGKIKRFIPAPSRADVIDTLVTPGFWILVVVFIIRVCYA